jgi:protocatechuate 3,4-dioxygenase alpha subunit
MAKRPETASQTTGPYVHIGCVPGFAGLDPDVVPQVGLVTGFEGTPVSLKGVIYDGAGAPVLDALVELWQADGDGVYHPDARGFVRAPTDPNTGEFRLETIKPGGVTPHLALWIVARGINIGLHTRVYFAGDDLSADPVLQSVPAGRRGTLIADERDGVYHFDIHLQGPRETVFFDV